MSKKSLKKKIASAEKAIARQKESQEALVHLVEDLTARLIEVEALVNIPPIHPSAPGVEVKKLPYETPRLEVLDPNDPRVMEAFPPRPPLVKEADPELERLLDEEEAIARNAHRSVPSDTELIDALELICHTVPNRTTMATWGPAVRYQVVNWAMQQHLIASDNEFEDHEILPKPRVLEAYAR